MAYKRKKNDCVWKQQKKKRKLDSSISNYSSDESSGSKSKNEDEIPEWKGKKKERYGPKRDFKWQQRADFFVVQTYRDARNVHRHIVQRGWTDQLTELIDESDALVGCAVQVFAGSKCIFIFCIYSLIT